MGKDKGKNVAVGGGNPNHAAQEVTKIVEQCLSENSNDC